MAIYVANNKKEERMLQIGSNKLELIDFRLKDYLPGQEPIGNPHYEGIYGINIAKVREINKITQFTKMPNCHECIEGLLELRDEAIPIINLAKYLGYKSYGIRSTDNVIICEFNSLVTGFIVHQAMRIRRISWEDIYPPSRLGGKEGGCVTGMHKLSKTSDNDESHMLLILDFEKIVAEMNGETDALNRFILQKQAHPPTNNEPRTVLLVDDSQTARIQVELFLSRHGYRVITATNGEEGLTTLNTIYENTKKEGRNIFEAIQVILTDVEMPRMDGHAFTQAIKKDPRFTSIPVLMHTSLSGWANQAAGKTLADEYVVKFNGEGLITMVDRVWKKAVQDYENSSHVNNEGSPHQLAS